MGAVWNFSIGWKANAVTLAESSRTIRDEKNTSKLANNLKSFLVAIEFKFQVLSWSTVLRKKPTCLVQMVPCVPSSVAVQQRQRSNQDTEELEQLTNENEKLRQEVAQLQREVKDLRSAKKYACTTDDLQSYRNFAAEKLYITVIIVVMMVILFWMIRLNCYQVYQRLPQ